jgi:predicted nucleotidyltransferase
MSCKGYRHGVDFVHPVEAVIPGAQGRVLAVLAETTAELNLRTVARLASVSVAQVSRVMPELVGLGLIDRREVPPASLFRLNREHVAARAIVELARSRDVAFERIGAAAEEMRVRPVSVIVFGSFARGEADAESDIDVILVRPGDVHEDDDQWAAAVEHWRDRVRLITGNRVEVLDVGRSEVINKLAGKASLWKDVVRDGVVVHGAALDDLGEVARA